MSQESPKSIIQKRCNPSRQYLVGKLRDYRSRLDLYAVRWQNDVEKKLIVASCISHMDDIDTMMQEDGAQWFKKSFSVWHLFHRVDENFYLLMVRPELKAQAWELIQGLKISPIVQQTKADWIIRLQEVLKKLEDPNINDTDIVPDAAQLLNSAAYIHNDCVDNLFWDYWCRKFFALAYTFSLLCVLLVFLKLYLSSHIIFCTQTAIILGAMGGLGSGILTTQIESIPYGQFWVSTLYHIFVRPIQGAVAALMVFWMLQSQYLIKIDPALAPGRTVFTCTSSARVELPVVCSPPSTSATFRNVSGSKQDPLLVLKAAPGMQVYLYMLVLLIAGFSGDKVLRFVTDKVTGKLFADAEKTKDGK